MYHVECSCGQQVRVELFQAGTETACPECHAAIMVPGSMKLRLLSDEPYPHLSALDKIAVTAENEEPPFDGVCHYCRKSTAEFSLPILLNVMVERKLDDDGGVAFGMTGPRFVVAKGEEQWRTIVFPLLFCGPCSRRFTNSRSNDSLIKFAAMLFVALLSFIFLYYATQLPVVHMVVGMAIPVVKFLVAVAAASMWILMFRFGKRKGSSLIPWVRRIRWVGEAIAAEDEYSISCGTMIPYQKRTSATRVVASNEYQMAEQEDLLDSEQIEIDFA